MIAMPLLNPVRIPFKIWYLFVDGPAGSWEIHGWLGYSVFLAF
jgi:hypothetical protein